MIPIAGRDPYVQAADPCNTMPVTASTRQGFGTELIRRQVERGLRGRIETSYDPPGLSATLSLPLDVEPQVISEG